MKHFHLTIALLFSSLSLFAQFGPEQIITTKAELPVSIMVADIDGDGFPDLVSGARFTNEVAWYKNMDGLGSFGPLQLIGASDEIRSVHAADLDGDNDLDVIATSGSQDLIFWYENLDGLGTFGPQQIIDNDADNANKVIAADIDGDGDNDIVAAIDFEQSAVWYENLDGNGTFGPLKYISFLVLGCRSVFAADIDGDGDLDVVANSGGSVTISWFENLDGLGNFGPQNIVAGEALYVADVFCADIDGDNDLDIVGTTNAEGKIAWHENLDGLGTFGPQQIITTMAVSCISIFCADLDNDGDIDVLFGSTPSSNVESSELAWCENLDGLGNFGAKMVLGNALQYTQTVYAADIDNDTDMDVFAASQNNDKIVWHENLTVLGIQDENLEEVKIYPNPVKEVLVIESVAAIKNVRIYSILGNKRLEVTKNFTEIPMVNLPSGILMVAIVTEQGVILKKLVKE